MVFGRFGKVSEVEGSEAKLLLGESLQVHSCDLSYLTLVSDLKPFAKFKSMVNLSRWVKQERFLKSIILKRYADSEEHDIFLDRLEVVTEKQQEIAQQHLNMALEFLKSALPLDYKLFQCVDPFFSEQLDFALQQAHREDSPEEKARHVDILLKMDVYFKCFIARRKKSSACPSSALSPVIIGPFWCWSLETFKLLRPAGIMILWILCTQVAKLKLKGSCSWPVKKKCCQQGSIMQGSLEQIVGIGLFTILRESTGQVWVRALLLQAGL